MDKGKQSAQEAGVPEHIALVDQGCHHICNPDWERRFSSLDDAVDRLLPYHVFDCEVADSADLREAEQAPGGACLAAPRAEVWAAQATQRAVELAAASHKLRQRLVIAERTCLERTQLPQYMLLAYAASEAQAVRQAEAAAEASRQLAERQAAAAAAAAQMQQAVAAQVAAAHAAAAGPSAPQAAAAAAAPAPAEVAAPGSQQPAAVVVAAAGVAPVARKPPTEDDKKKAMMAMLARINKTKR